MKKLLRRLLVLGVLLVVLGVAAFLFAGAALERAVEAGGSYALGVPVTLERASPSWSSGELELAELEVANPPGFATPFFLRMRDARAQVALPTLLKERVDIPSIVLDGLELNLERTSRGSNYGALLASLERFEKGGAEQSEPSRKKLVVQKFVLRNVRVHASLVPELGSSTDVDLTLAQIELNDLGETSVAQLVAQVIEALLQKTLEAGGGSLPKELLKDLGGSLERLGQDRLGELRRRLGTGLEGLGGKLEEVFK